MATNSATNQIGPLDSFMSINDAQQLNITGDGTDATIAFSNEIYDTTSAFSSPTFTASLQGLYLFHFEIVLGYPGGAPNINGVNDLEVYLATTSATYYFYKVNLTPGLGAANAIFIMSGCTLAPMSAGNTASLHIMANGLGAKPLLIEGAGTAGYRTPVFAGYKVAGI